MNENPKEKQIDKWTELEDRAAGQINAFCGDSTEYLAWFVTYEPEKYKQIEIFLQALDRAHGILPLGPYEQLLAIHVASQKFLFAMWNVRDELERLKLSVTSFNGPVM